MVCDELKHVLQNTEINFVVTDARGLYALTALVEALAAILPAIEKILMLEKQYLTAPLTPVILNPTKFTLNM